MSVFGKRTATLCLLFLSPTFAASYAKALHPQSRAAVEGFELKANQDSVEVTLTATSDVQFTYFRLEGPRLVLDFHDAEDRLAFSQKTVGAGGLAQVRAAPFADATREVTRIVFDLEEGTVSSVVREGPGRFRVRFEAAPLAAASEGPIAEVAAPPPGSPDAEPTPPDAEPTPRMPASRVPLDTGFDAGFDTGFAAAALDETAPIQLASLAAAAPRALEFPSFASERFQSETRVEIPVPGANPAPVEPQPLRTVPSGAPANSMLTSASAGTSPGVFSEPVLASAAGAPGPPQPTLSPQVVSPIPTPQYTGEIYSFDFRNLELGDFFRTITDISGLNVILDPGIPNQTLTMVLNDVPWDQALDIVLRSYNLAWELNGNVLRIALQQTLQAEEERRREYRELQEQNGPLVQNTYVLSYTDADTAAPLVDNLLSPRGAVVPMAGRNALMVTDIESRFPSIENMIDFLDTPAQQVEIVARLLQANKTFRRDLGNQLGVIFNNGGANVLTGLPTLPSPFVRTPPPSVTSGGTASLPLVADFGIAAPTAGLSLLLGVGGDVLLDNIIQIAETRGTARLLSRPNVVVQNNEAAVIEQGTQIPVQTNVNNTISVQFQQFALRLEVTPQITEEGTILLNAVIENSTPDFSQQVDGIPSIATQRAQTRVLIGDGETAYVGGILIDSDSVNVSQIPGLGSIPILGYLFKSTSTVRGTSELLFFVTARIKPAGPIDFLSAGLTPDLENLFALEPPAGILREERELGAPGVD